jgi:hypothetical protein
MIGFLESDGKGSYFYPLPRRNIYPLGILMICQGRTAIPFRSVEGQGFVPVSQIRLHLDRILKAANIRNMIGMVVGQKNRVEIVDVKKCWQFGEDRGSAFQQNG